MTYVVWIAIALAAVVFCLFAGWPLYNTYRTRGLGADVAEGQAYFKAKARAEAEARAGAESEDGRPGTAPVGSGPSSARDADGRGASRPPVRDSPAVTTQTDDYDPPRAAH